MLSKPQRDFHSKLEIEHCLVEENLSLTLLFCYISRVFIQSFVVYLFFVNFSIFVLENKNKENYH